VTLSIGELGRRTGTKVETIRYYERIGLLAAPARTEGNYRAYGKAELNRLSFIRRARDLGFSVAEIGDLLSLWRNESRQSAEVKQMAQGHINGLQKKIKDLKEMAHSLTMLVNACHGDHRPHCPILQSLEKGKAGEDRSILPRRGAVARP